MKCLKCLNNIKCGVKGVGLKGIKPNQHLSHLGGWDICNKCNKKELDRAKKVREGYYKENKTRYRKLHKNYKSSLTDSYVANAIAERSNLKAKDIPKSIIELKRQYMKLNRLVKK